VNEENTKNKESRSKALGNGFSLSQARKGPEYDVPD
jgi:hypothetical protein